MKFAKSIVIKISSFPVFHSIITLEANSYCSKHVKDELKLLYIMFCTLVLWYFSKAANLCFTILHGFTSERSKISTLARIIEHEVGFLI